MDRLLGTPTRPQPRQGLVMFELIPVLIFCLVAVPAFAIEYTMRGHDLSQVQRLNLRLLAFLSWPGLMLARRRLSQRRRAH